MGTNGTPELDTMDSRYSSVRFSQNKMRLLRMTSLHVGSVARMQCATLTIPAMKKA
jgi:hypothetical protein